MAKVKMQCSPYCSFFPDMTCNNWVYDENDPNIKRRKEKKEYMIITEPIWVTFRN